MNNDGKDNQVMDFFDLPVNKRYTRMDRLLSNVNLAEIKIGGMNEATFIFINTFNGKYLKTLKCNNVVKLSYENVDVDGFACFIGEVYSKKILSENTRETFKHFNLGSNYLLNKDCFLISIEGGEIDIDLLCESFELID